VNTRRPRAKRGQGEHLRAEILDAAEAILLETGSTDKVSTRAVAQRVGCSSPSIYLHFPDRAQLLFAVCERQFEKLASQLRAAAEQHDDPVERLRAIGITYCEFALANPQQYRTMMMDVIAGQVYERDLEEMRGELGFDVLFDTVVAGMESGVFAADNPLRAAFNQWCVAHGVVSLMIAKPHIAWGDDRSLYEGAVEQSIVGLLAHPPAAPKAPKKSGTKRTTTRTG
jgi:AcrR family transcriptional regulator